MFAKTTQSLAAAAAMMTSAMLAMPLPAVAESAPAATAAPATTPPSTTPPAPTATAAAAAMPAKPSAVDVLFEAKHLGNINAGEQAKYRFQRTVSDPKMLGEPFNDDITLGVDKLNADGTRNVTLKIFTGERARTPESVPDLTGNPVLVLFLDRAVSNYEALAGGNRNYLKGRFRDGLREKAKIEPVKIDYNGKSVDGYRVTLLPYEGDPNALRMMGYEGSQFTFLVSPSVPGELAELVAHYESGVKGAPKLEERITLAGIGGAK